MKNKLISKYEGILSFQSRVVMSAMTRGFADENHCATSEMATYYEKRAKHGVGLILTEGIVIDASADGYNSVPHLSTVTQMESWKNVCSKVHAHGAKIYAQLWHCGRISHSDFCNGSSPVSSTDKEAAGINRQNNKQYGKPRKLNSGDMSGVYELFLHSARLAFEAGFDGIEVHMGHGYLVDQFFDLKVNDRDDEYGQTIENRCRFGIELLEHLLEEIDPKLIMPRISPSRFMGGIYEWDDMDEMLNYFLEKIQALGIEQLDVSCANADYYDTSGKVIRSIRKIWKGILIGGASLTQHEALKEIDDGWVDMVTFGRALLANPDLVQKFISGKELVPFDNDMRDTLV